jgi:hypothetical protein
MGWAGHVYFGVDHWIYTERSFARLRRRISAERVLEVNYEALVCNPESELGRICKFLGDKFDPDMLCYAKDTTYSAPDAAYVEQWRHKLSQREVALVEARAGKLLHDAGYAPSGYPAVLPNMMERFILRQVSRARRNFFELQRYGVLPFIARKTSAIAPFPSLTNYADHCYHSIMEQHLK